MEVSDRIAFLEANLARQLHWIRLADSKVAFVFTANTAMLGILAGIAPASTASWTTAPAICASFALAFGIAGLLFLSFAAFPRTGGPKGSLLFFGGIAQRDSEQFKRAVLSLSHEAYIDDLSTQCHRNGEIATQKFAWVQRALFCLYLSVIPWGLSLWLLYNGQTP
jgi:hypothetical protein